jgi:hypothetical protein
MKIKIKDLRNLIAESLLVEAHELKVIELAPGDEFE